MAGATHKGDAAHLGKAGWFPLRIDLAIDRRWAPWIGVAAALAVLATGLRVSEHPPQVSQPRALLGTDHAAIGPAAPRGDRTASQTSLVLYGGVRPVISAALARF